MFAYGFLAVVLVLYLAAAGLDPLAIGIVLTLTLIGDTIISLWLTTNADRFGRRRTLIVGSALMIVAGIAFAFTSWVPLLILAGAIGVISPTGNEVGPFLAIEQAGLSQTIPDNRRTPTFAWYNLAGYVATATGALGAGLLSQALLDSGWAPLDAYRAIVIGYALLGLVMVIGFWQLDKGVEAPPREASTDGIRRRLGLGRSKKVVLKLSVLFSLDAFGGGFIPQSLMAYWFHIQYGVDPATLGADLLRREPAGRRLVAPGGTDRGADRPAQHDGLHPPAVERAAHPRPDHAEPAARRSPSCSCATRSARWTSRRGSRTSSRSSTRTSARQRPG